MSLPSLFPLFLLTSQHSTFLTTTILTLLTLKITSRLYTTLFTKPQPKILRGPATTVLPFLTQEQKDELPYPPDAYPGGRDIESAYGSTRVYEWGPDEGRKVLFVHGITTACLTLGPIAHMLADRGCRVMLFDCWGRGYSDAPTGLPYDARLYTTQILLAITSSPLPWTTTPGFSLIGYSLGGGISASFASQFPDMIDSLVLLTPTGLIRAERTRSQRRLLEVISLLPECLVERFVKRKLQMPMFPGEEKRAILGDGGEETPDEETVPVSRTYPDITVIEAQRWQIKVHEGFFTSFMSTGRYAPYANEHETWKRLALRKDKILIVTATKDPIVNPNELKEDATNVVGEGRLEIALIEGAHDIPVTDPGKIVDAIWKFWKT
ncbi:Alpha/Beta hydrolase protein [Rhexocercosporidium sp. MPI-PUGE-AT-0058]|nr:Alpha/Beta hydrolase protein [Rhexocercosporidium sp. MPI-PUGE-AT-0058]